MAESDVKPKLNLHIQNDGGEKITVAAKRDTKFAKIFSAAEKRWGKDAGTFKFTYEGARIRPEQTLGDVGIEDDDTIDAHLEQLGGC
ncbi:ubiquitin-like protein [Cylindrobasidium torrendii FP15055 ss-10]|uniref:Ubiquitin-like protein n=1 Tax=Cylindrobasidium torrendii FP15055 ss-10 TaxID=1314674 RepID=A0A0D7BUL8_9AGAR|nr:ubiquitin-like protein [Cylindrobasidium torrendii FP15055 ss-10]